MIAPYGWTLDTVYFDSNYSYHLDCVLSPLREGLLAYPKDVFWSPLPQWLQNWDHIDVSRSDNVIGANNNVPLGNNKVIICKEATEFCANVDKAGVEVVPVPYLNLYSIFGSGFHCSSAAIHRES